MSMSIPVYLFTGFLDAGKTAFIQETLEDPGFNTGEKTLDENHYTVVDLEDDFPVERFYQYFNEPKAL